MKHLTEENLGQYIVQSLSKNKSYISIFDDARAYSQGLEQFSSFTSNYIAVFIYELMRAKPSPDIFEHTMAHIFTVSNTKEMFHSFHRFFSSRDADITLKEYVQQNRHKNDFSLWDNMGYYFLDINNNKLELYEPHLTYLISILSNFNTNNIDALHEAHFSRFCYNFLFEPEKLIPILNAVKDNPAYYQENKDKYHSFFTGLLVDLSSAAYDMNIEQKSHIYCVLSEHVHNFEEIFKKRLMKRSYRGELDVDMGLLRFIDVIGSDKMVQWLQTGMENEMNLKETDYKKFLVVQNFTSSIDIGLEDEFFTCDYSALDLNKTLLQNLIIFKLLEIQVKQDQKVPFIPHLKEYLNEQIIVENNKKNEDSAASNFTEIDKILKYMDYAHLNELLPTSENKIKRPKI